MTDGLWFVLAVFAALLYGGHSVYVKGLLRDVDQLLMTWSLFALSFPVFCAVVVWQGIPEVDSSFYIPLAVSLGINLVGWPLFVRAIQISDISLVMPMVALTPAFILGVEYLLLGAVPASP